MSDTIPHSPAPWRVAEIPCGNLIVEAFGGRSVVLFQTKSLDREGWAYAGHIANARLIAAAPDMSDVVDMVIATIDPACTVENDIYGDSRETNEKFAALLRAAWAAKAKAVQS